MSSAMIRIKGVDFFRGGYIGKMVRMTGVLEKEIHRAIPSDAKYPVQGIGQDTIEYSVKITKWEPIDRIERPYLEVLP